jgi:hypothetical protein
MRDDVVAGAAQYLPAGQSNRAQPNVMEPRTYRERNKVTVIGSLTGTFVGLSD